MPFDQFFLRGEGVASPPPALGSDPDPTTLSGDPAIAYASRDNAIQFQLQQGGASPDSLAVAVQYDGAGSPGLASVAIYLWEPQITGTWLTLTPIEMEIGEVVIAQVPVVQSALSTAWTLA